MWAMLIFGVVGLASMALGLGGYYINDGAGYRSNNEALGAVSVFFIIVGAIMVCLATIAWFINIATALTGGTI